MAYYEKLFVQVPSNLQMSPTQAITAPRFRHGVLSDAAALTSFTTALLRRDSHGAVVTSSVNTTVEVERGFALSAADMRVLQSTYGVTVKVYPFDAPFEDSAFGACQVLLHG